MANSVTDLEALLKNSAWEVYHKTANNGSSQKFDDTQMDVNWDRVKFNSGSPNFFKKEKRRNVNSQVLFRSQFDNDTNQNQNHNFKTERTTMAQVTTSLKKGFTKGFNTGLKMEVPEEVSNATAAFGNEVRIDSEDENTSHHGLTWSVDTTVRAPEYKRTVARLEVKEEDFECSFKMSVTFRGTVIVRLSSIQTGKTLMNVQFDIATFLGDMSPSIPRCVEFNNKTVTWPVLGDAYFYYGVTQRVRVHQEELPEDDDDDDDEDDDDEQGEY